MALNVFSLFTALSVDQVVNIIKQRLKKIKPHTQHFNSVQHLYFKSYFNLGKLLQTNLWLGYWKMHVSYLPFSMYLLKRFVINLVTAIPNGEETAILNIFSSFLNRLQFTIKKETLSWISNS